MSKPKLDLQSFKRDLAALVALNTVDSPKTAGMPFGKNNADALASFLSIAKQMGFNVINYDNYAGEVYYGEGEEIGIIGHLDVVPAGEGWTTDPFALSERNGVLYGRGVADDKGPMLICLYALKALKDSGITLRRKFRLFAGCNEETGWKDVDYLSKKTVLPEYGFSPDGNFPVSYAEKGVFVITFTLPALKLFTNVTGGNVVNAVCEHAFATARLGGIDQSLLEKHGLKVTDCVIESVGKAAHGSTPHLGKNALLPLFSYFADMGENLTNAIECLFFDKHGLSTLQNEQGKVTLSPDVVYEKNDKLYIVCDCRVPAPFTEHDVKVIIEKFGIEYSLSQKHPPVMVDKDGAFVQTLLNAYSQVTGEQAAAQALGGSTFARAFSKGCAFGAEFPSRDHRIHDADENFAISDVERAFEIYSTALFALAKGN